MDSNQAQQPDDQFSFHLHEVSRERLTALTEVLNASRSAVIAQAVSRWVVQAGESRGPYLTWYVEHPFQENAQRRGKRLAGTFKIGPRLPERTIRQIESLAEMLHVTLSAVVEQALLRWCREDPLLSSANEKSNGAAKSNGTSNYQQEEA